MKLKSDRKKYIIIGLCAILLVMSVGYAAFRSLLRINGTATLTSSFCIGFDNTKTNTYVPTPGMTGSTVPSGTMTYSGAACSTKYQPSATLSSNFKLPGDKIEYTLTITNKSTFAVAIKSILVENQSVTSNTTITKGNVNYIVEMPLSTTLAADAETTMKVIAEFQNDTNITGNYTGEHQTLDVKINAEQDNGSGGFTPIVPVNGTIYRGGATILANKGSSHAETYPYTIAGLTKGTDYIMETDYSTYTARVTALGKQHYIKHNVANDEIINSYVCFVYNNVEHCMIGADGGAAFSENTQTIKDYQSFYNLETKYDASLTNEGCNYTYSESKCYGGDFKAIFAYSNGAVSALSQPRENCFVNADGNSRCVVWS